MASGHEPKKSRDNSIKLAAKAGQTSVNRVISIEAIGPTGQWDQDGDDGLAAAIRVFFLSHTLDPLTGEVHTVH